MKFEIHGSPFQTDITIQLGDGMWIVRCEKCCEEAIYSGFTMLTHPKECWSYLTVEAVGGADNEAPE